MFQDLFLIGSWFSVLHHRIKACIYVYVCVSAQEWAMKTTEIASWTLFHTGHVVLNVQFSFSPRFLNCSTSLSVSLLHDSGV